MTVFCITLFHMCAICVSCLWRAEIPHFICNRSLFVRLTRPSYFGMSKQSCRKAGFYILLWSFHGEVVIPAERERERGKKRFQLCLLPLLRLPYSLPFARDACAILLSTKPVRGWNTRNRSRENKRFWSELQRRSLTFRPSPFRQLCAPEKTNIGFLFLRTAINIPTQPNYVSSDEKTKKTRKHFKKYFSPQNPLGPILAYSFIACFWFVASSIIALPLTKQRACLRACLLEPHAEWCPSDSCERHPNLTAAL